MKSDECPKYFSSGLFNKVFFSKVLSLRDGFQDKYTLKTSTDLIMCGIVEGVQSLISNKCQVEVQSNKTNF